MNVNFNPAKQRAEETKYLGHSNEHPALQAHSVNDLYPWSITVRGGNYLYPQHLTSNATGPRQSYNPKAEDNATNSFKAAHDRAEQWIRNHKGLSIAQQPTAASVV